MRKTQKMSEPILEPTIISSKPDEQKMFVLHNGRVMTYTHLPIEVFSCHNNNCRFAGRSNFKPTNHDYASRNVESLEEAFNYLKRWQKENNYVAGYIADYANKTLFYNNQNVVFEHFKLLERQSVFEFLEKRVKVRVLRKALANFSLPELPEDHP